MTQDSAGAPGLMVIWPTKATATGTSSPSGIAQRLDLVQARLEALEEHLARLDQQTPLAADLERELHEIRWQVAGLTAEVLGADHPLARLVAPLRDDRLSHERPHGEVTLAESPRRSWLAGGRLHGLVNRVVCVLPRWLLGRT